MKQVGNWGNKRGGSTGPATGYTKTEADNRFLNKTTNASQRVNSSVLFVNELNLNGRALSGVGLGTQYTAGANLNNITNITEPMNINIATNTTDIDILKLRHSFDVKGEYSSTTTYKVLDLVWFDKPGGKVKFVAYISIANNNIGNTPSSSPAQWLKPGISDAIYVSQTQYDVFTAAQTTNNATQQTSIDGKANNNEVVKLSGNQTIDGIKTFSSKIIIKDKNVAINFVNSDASFLAWYENNGTTRTCYFGKGSAGSNNIVVGGLEAFQIDTTLGLDMNNKPLFNLPTPINDGDGVAKKYVDAADLVLTNDIIESNDKLALKADISEVVDLTSTQQITGTKTFNKRVRVDGGLFLGTDQLLNASFGSVVVKTATEYNEPVPLQQVQDLIKNTSDVIPNVEYNTGRKLNGKILYGQYITRGDVYANSFVKIPSSGILVTGVATYGVIGGAILRNADALQVHNISNISNAPDQHASIVWFDPIAHSIKYWYNKDMTQNQFFSAPFTVEVVYTKME